MKSSKGISKVSLYKKKLINNSENEEEKLFSTIFENNVLPMSIASMEESRIIRVNPAFLKKMGYSKEELIGKSARDLNILVGSSKLSYVLKKLKNNEKIIDEEFIVRQKNGTLLNVLFALEKIVYRGEDSFIATIFDITDRVKLIKSEKDRCQKLINIIEGTNLGTWEWNIKTGELEINKQWASMLGYSLKELKPISIETWRAVTHPEDLKKAEKVLIDYINGEIDHYDCEVRLIHKNGNHIWVRTRGKVTKKDRSGSPLIMFGTHSDITKRKQADKELIESEKRFLLALDEAEAGLWDYDNINKTMFLSPMWKKLLGYRDDEIENSYQAWLDIVHPEDRPNIDYVLEDYMNGKSKTYENIHRLKHKNGEWKWILTRGGMIKDEYGQPKRWIGTIVDITKEREQSLELERYFSVNLDLICIANLETYILNVNKAWQDILGYPVDEIKGIRFIELVHEDDVEDTLKVMEEIKKGKKNIHTMNRYICKNGDVKYIEWRADLYEDIIYASGRDITERIEYEHKILEISNKDALTGIYNRRHVYDRALEIIEDYKRKGRVFSVCIIDIDDFKYINDKHGHHVGDYTLKAFTKVISENLRPYDILGRYGGEEFIVVFTDTGRDESGLVIERILNIIRKKIFEFDNKQISFTFSAGIASSDEIGKDELIIDELVEIADRRMYSAKNSGKNKVLF